MPYYRRNLPHYWHPGATIFLTWHLYGSLPICKRATTTQTAGKAFAETDHQLDHQTNGPQWLKDPRIATTVTEAFQEGEAKRFYENQAWAIMPNHVHLLIKLLTPLPEATKWLKGSTARAANQVLGRTGQPFWQYETYDHWVRTTNELTNVIAYIERNPVSAGLASSPEDYAWSSASACLLDFSARQR